MTDDLAARLLDAQVSWIVDRLTGDDLAGLIGEAVDDLVEIGARVPLESVADPDAIKAVVRRAIVASAGSPLIESIVDTAVDAVYELRAADEHELGAVVAREHVDALVTKILSMRQLHEQVMARMFESPAVGDIASQFVGRIVSDFVNANRERMEKLPGAKSLIGIGLGAANKVRTATQDTFIGDAAGKGAQFAIKRTNAATRDLLQDARLREAALELWDLQAAETVAALREYATAGDLRELAQIIRLIVADARDSDYVGELIDGVVDAVFETYGGRDVADLLADLGLTPDELRHTLEQTAPMLLETLRDTGDLEHLVRTRLAPFFESDAYAAAVAG